MTSNHIAPTTLSFNGVAVRDKGEMLSLTDMWKASGSPSGRAPSDWLALSSAKDFVVHVEASLNAGNPGIYAKSGRGGSTFAHWQIALAYAKYLSPEFHMQCNAIIRERMEGASTPQAFPAIPDFTNPAAAARAWADQFEARLIAERTKAEIGARREATAMNTASQAVKRANRLEVELDRSRSYATVKRMGLLHHGQDFSWRVLKRMSEQMGVLPIDVFDANYGTVKAYHADVWQAAYALDIPQRDEDASEDSGEGAAMRSGPVLAIDNAAGRQ